MPSVERGQPPDEAALTDARAQRRRAVRRAAASRSRAESPTLALTTLVLDIGGVVVPTLFEVIDACDFPAGPFGEDARYRDVERGRIQERDYWAELRARRPDLDLAHVMRTGLRVRAEIRELLDDLGGRIRLAALTNDMAHWFGNTWTSSFPEFARFDSLLEAAQSGVLKPDPSVFRWALTQLGEPAAQECLFVDDLPSNLRGAAAAGMAVEHFDVTDPAGSVRRIVRRFGLGGSAATARTFRPREPRR